MKKSMAALSAMLGTVYAGCFYSVLDPEQPQERIREIFRVLSPEIVVLENTEDEKVLEKIQHYYYMEYNNLNQGEDYIKELFIP